MAQSADFCVFFLLFTASVRSRPPGPHLVPGATTTQYACRVSGGRKVNGGEGGLGIGIERNKIEDHIEKRPQMGTFFK